MTCNHPKVKASLDRLNNYKCFVSVLDNPFTIDELTVGIKKLGNGCGLDGIPAAVIKMLPPSFLNCILEIMKGIFDGPYPKEWEKQILHAVAKDGHTSLNPKLRGIGIAVILARLYDIILNERFQKWYVPNKEQAGFRKGHGCLLPLFSIFLLLHYTVKNKKEFCIGFMDYEKAFDYSNRSKIVSKMMDKGCGKKFTEAITKMFNSTTYIPSSNNKLFEEIATSYGVAQGRNSSTNLYSFSVSDMPSCTKKILHKDFIDPFNLAQLADDTAVLAEDLSLLSQKMKCLMDYSHLIHQVPNIPKTVYCHFSSNPITSPLHIDKTIELSSIDPIKGQRYLGVKFLPTKDVSKIIEFNINGRSHNWSKFYAWLDVNEVTPIEIKLSVLDNCLFNSIMYAVKVMGDISCVEKKLRLSEQKALRSILKVKKGTCIDLLYHELKRPDIISRIKDLQFKFFEKLKKLNEEEAVIKSILNICNDTSFVKYYKSLQYSYKENDVKNREMKIINAESGMLQYYASIANAKVKSNIYSNFADDRFRAAITRWRLSNHKLQIETGRYNGTPRENRKCYTCNAVENEEHAVFVCPIFAYIRTNFKRIIEKYKSIRTLLNPDSTDINEVGIMLLQFDKHLNYRV